MPCYENRQEQWKIQGVVEGIINSLAWSHADFFPVYLLHPSSAFILIIISFIVSHFPEVHVQRWIKDSFSSYMHD